MALTPLKKTYELENIAVLDIETSPRWLDYEELESIPLEILKEQWNGVKPEPFLVCWYDHTTKEEYVFDGETCVEDFLTFYLTKKHRNKTTFAHYGGRFDFLPLYEELECNSVFSGFKKKVVYLNGGILLLRIFDKHRDMWSFRDSRYLLNHSLEKLCASFNSVSRKLAMPKVPYEKDRKTWKAYCMNDCKSLAEVLNSLNNIIVHQIGGCMGLTISSTALRTFRRKFLKRELPTYFQWNDFIRMGFYGGRTEVFKMYAPLRGEPYYLVDVNSMYPSVMHDNVFPVSVPKRVTYSSPWDVSGRCGFMECEVKSPMDLDVPVLPFRDESKYGKLIFPVGCWTGVYEFSLIEKALECGYKITPLRTIEFQGDYLFKEYVETLYELKRKSIGALRETTKLLLNGLYGKFGEQSRREELVTDFDADITGTYPLPDNPMGYTTREVVRFCAHHLPGIAARVTALAQLKLFDGMKRIFERGGSVYYVDTDSMVVDVRIPTSDRLGDWNLKTELTRGVFFAPKTYCFEYVQEDGEIGIEQHMKGFSSDFVHSLTFDDFLNALPPKNDYSVFCENSMHPASFKEILTRSLPGFSILVKSRSVKKGYDKRMFADAYGTVPLRIFK